MSKQEDGAVRPDMRQSLVEAGLTLIDKAQGCRGVTLRAIANRAGCAHTNVYNYFSSLESVFWACLPEAQRRNMEFLESKVAQAAPGTSAVLESLTRAQLEFAQVHPGWYRLIWLEPVDGPIPPQLIPRLKQPRETVAGMLRPLFDPGISEADLHRIADLLHTYVHGEICKRITRRDLPGRTSSEPVSISENALLLLRLLQKEFQPGNRGEV